MPNPTKTIFTNSMKYHSHVHPVSPYAARIQQDTRNLPLSSLFTTTSVVWLWHLSMTTSNSLPLGSLGTPGLPGYPRPLARCRKWKNNSHGDSWPEPMDRVGYSNTEQTKLEERFCTHFFKNLIQDTLVIRPPWWSSIHNQFTICCHVILTNQ